MSHATFELIVSTEDRPFSTTVESAAKVAPRFRHALDNLYGAYHDYDAWRSRLATASKQLAERAESVSDVTRSLPAREPDLSWLRSSMAECERCAYHMAIYAAMITAIVQLNPELEAVLKSALSK